MASKKQLWEAQLRAYPDSVKISHKDMLRWVCDAPKDAQPALWVGLGVCLAETPNGIFYRTTNDLSAYVGFRYGIEDQNYSGNFPKYNIW